MVQGALICARILPGQIVTAMVRQDARRIGHEDVGGRSPGLSLHPYIAADLRAPIAGGEREPGAGLPRMQGSCPWYSVNRNTPTRPG